MHFDVCHVTIDEKDAMIKNLLANHNAALAAKAGLTQSEEGTVIECEVDNEGFV
jgi:hypothetical protein